MLYEICKLSQINIDSTLGLTSKLFNKNRPIHGMHLSLNRFPFNKDVTYKLSMAQKYLKNFLKIINNENFIYLNNFCPIFFEYLNTFQTFLKI